MNDAERESIWYKDKVSPLVDIFLFFLGSAFAQLLLSLPKDRECFGSWNRCWKLEQIKGELDKTPKEQFPFRQNLNANVRKVLNEN